MSESRAPHAIPVAEIADKLAAQIENLCADILPNGRKQGHEWAIGGIDGSAGKSMMINLGSRAGVWMDFASGHGGDAIDLVAAVRFGGDKGAAIRWARSWLGLDGLDPKRLKVTMAASRAKPSTDESRLDDAERRDKAARMWRGGKRFTDAYGGFKTTPAADYLCGRGIHFQQLGRVPGVLTYSAGAWNGEAQANIPAMLAAVMQRNVIAGVHRTFLQIDGPGRASKARVMNPKLTLGPIRGGVIPLWRGASRLAWSALWDAELSIEWPETEADKAVTLTEGIEDALSLAIAAPERRVVACVSLANMGSAVLPPCLTDVTIAADNDAAGSVAEAKGLPRVIDALQAQGRTVRVARPPAGHKDFNAWMQALQVPAPAEAVA